MSSTQTAKDTYRIDAWGLNYFSINDQGQVCVNLPCTEKPSSEIALTDIMEAAKSKGIKPPVLIRFPAILGDRVKAQKAAFLKAQHLQQYQGQYQPVYPIKVNQERHVIEALLNTNKSLGLEAGSKAELLTILSVTKKPTTIICNGYKDASFVELVFIAQMLGHDVTLVIEKSWELALIAQFKCQYEAMPTLGIRVRLSSISKGQWQNTGGEKSKFGLSSQELLNSIQQLREHELLQHLKLLHVHLGSQISNLKDLEIGLTEASQFYVALFQQDVMLETLDIGGGLAVDYTGGKTNDCFSSAYHIAEYAHTIVRCIKNTCDKHKIPHPNIITESGRALTAHHAVLVTNILGIESKNITATHTKHSPALVELHKCWDEISNADHVDSLKIKSLSNRANLALQSDTQCFIDGKGSLENKALAENLHNKILHRLCHLNQDKESSIQSTLQEFCSSKIICNFSVFSSTPDIWGIEQVFPILPIEKLDQPLTEQAVLHDITCDSDGRIDAYVSDGKITQSLSVPVLEKDDKMAFFLVGAYQEILGDIHNLFGDTHSIQVEAEGEGWSITDVVEGEKVADLMHYLHFDTEAAQVHYKQLISFIDSSQETKEKLLKKLSTYLQEYSYPSF